MRLGFGELVLLMFVVGILVIFWRLRAKGALIRYDATKTLTGNVSDDAVLSAISARTTNLGVVKQSEPLVVEGFNTNLGGACQITEVTFAVRRSGQRIVVSAGARQRPSLLAWILLVVGVFFYILPAIGVVFWFYLSKAFVQREVWRVLDEVAEELNAPVETPSKSLASNDQTGAASAGQTDGKTCPFCAERIKREAVVCRYCARDLVGTTPVST